MGLFNKFKKKEEPKQGLLSLEDLDEPPAPAEGVHNTSVEVSDLEVPSVSKDRDDGVPNLPRELKSGGEVEFPMPPKTNMGMDEELPKPTMAEKPPEHEDVHFIDIPKTPNLPSVGHEEKVFDPLPKPVEEKHEPVPEQVSVEEPKTMRKPIIFAKEGLMKRPQVPIDVKPVHFVTMVVFEELVDVLNSLLDETHLSDDTMYRLNDIAEQEERLYGRWHNLLDDVTDKIDYIDKKLFSL